MHRRTLLRASLIAAEFALLAGAGLLKPRQVLAAWPAPAFNAENLDAALKALSGGAPITDSDALVLSAPEQAADGRTVPVEVISNIPGTRSIALLSEKNPFPALSRFDLTPAVTATLAVRIKMGGSGKVVALVEADGRYYSASRRVEVAVGGC